MFKIKFNKKGIMLFMVLGTLLIVAVLASIILSIILSHGRLTQHQTSRIQAYYAAMAGMNLAMENLRSGSWEYNKNYCINCTSGVPLPRIVSDPDLPCEVMIDIGKIGDDPPGSASAIPNTAPITVTATYITP